MKRITVDEAKTMDFGDAAQQLVERVKESAELLEVLEKAGKLQEGFGKACAQAVTTLGANLLREYWIDDKPGVANDGESLRGS